MKLIEVDYQYVARWARSAARERVSVSPTANTRWYRAVGHEGFCGLLKRGDTLRVKGVYVHPEWRGQGIGAAMTDALLRIAEAAPEGRIEVLAYNPSFYEARGFERAGQLRNGAWRLTRGKAIQGDHR